MQIVWKLLALGSIIAALSVLPLPLAALLVLAAIGGVLALIDPLWAVCAAILAVLAQDLLLLPGGLSLVQAALLLALGAWALRVLAYPEQRILMGHILPGLLLLLWALALASITTPYSLSEAFKETLRWSFVLLIYVLVLNTVAVGAYPRLRVLGLVACLLLAPATNALLGLWQFFTGTGPPGFIIEDEFARAYGTIGQPNSFAGYMKMGWPLAVALALGAVWALGVWLWQRYRWPEARQQGPLLALLVLPFAGGTAALLIGALLVSLSRGGWVGAVGGAAAMLLAGVLKLDHTQRARVWQWAGAAAVGAVLLVTLGGSGVLPNVLTERVASIIVNIRLFDVRNVEITPDNFAIVERMAQIQSGWNMFLDYPLTGVGPGNYTLAYEGGPGFRAAPYYFHPWYTSRGHAHNYYLHMAAESGIMGLLAYLILLGVLIRQAYRSLIRAQGWFWCGIAIGGCGIIASVMVHNLFENLHVLNMGVQLGAVWGLLEVVERRLTHE